MRKEKGSSWMEQRIGSNPRKSDKEKPKKLSAEEIAQKQQAQIALEEKESRRLERAQEALTFSGSGELEADLAKILEKEEKKKELTLEEAILKAIYGSPAYTVQEQGGSLRQAAPAERMVYRELFLELLSAVQGKDTQENTSAILKKIENARDILFLNTPWREWNWSPERILRVLDALVLLEQAEKRRKGAEKTWQGSQDRKRKVELSMEAYFSEEFESAKKHHKNNNHRPLQALLSLIYLPEDIRRCFQDEHFVTLIRKHEDVLKSIKQSRAVDFLGDIKKIFPNANDVVIQEDSTQHTNVPEGTKAYIGNNAHAISNFFKSVEYAWIFSKENKKEPYKKIGVYDFKSGGKSEEEYVKILKEKKIDFNNAIPMFGHDDFGLSIRVQDPNRPGEIKKCNIRSPEEIHLVRISVEDLGFPNGATLKEIYARAEKLGLELCRPEDGPDLALRIVNQVTNRGVNVGMKPVKILGGGHNIFRVVLTENRVHLLTHMAYLDLFILFDVNAEFVFRLRKNP